MKLRRLLMASALALSFTVSAPAVAKADPISAAVVTFIGFTGTAAAVATFVINTALYAVGSWALTKAASALGLIKNAVAERQASVTSLTLGESPRELVIGEACTGGTLVDAWNWGGKYNTDYVTRCIALADHEVDRLLGYYVDDQYYAYAGNGNQAAFNGALRLIFVNATANGSNPPADVGASNGGWTNADKVVGVTHVWVVTKVDDKVWTQGHPRFKFVLRGLKAYDPRRDAALGYTGPNPHVWENPATHAFTRNAAVLRYNFQRGVYATGRQGQDGHLLIGRGLSAEEAPPARIIAAANLCDEIVDGEARYTANGVISAAQTFIEVEEMFAAAMAGVIVQRDGGVEVEPGQAKAVVRTITDADLVAGEPVSFSNFLPDTDGGRINTVIPRYVEPAQGWKDHGGIIRRDPSDLIEDGRPLEMTLPLMLVTSGKQADRCAEIARRKGRLERRASIVLPPDYAEVEEGDWIAWTSARYTNGATVRWQITSYSLGPDWRQHLTLEEIASSVFGVPDPEPDTTNPPPPPVPVDALQLFGPKAEAITLAGEVAVDDGEGGTIPGPGTAIPAVRFTWGRTFDDEGEVDETEAPDAALVQIRAEIRRAGSTDVASALTDDIFADAWVVTNGVIPDATLECRLTPIAASPTRPVLPSAWMTVTTGSVTSRLDPDNPVLTDLRNEITGALEDAVATLEAADTALGDALTTAIDTLGGAIEEVDSGLDGLQVIVAQHTTDLANKADLSTLNVQIARIDGHTAQLSTLSTTVADFPNQYVSAATFGSLSSEIAAARNGSTNLGAQLTTMRQTVTDGLAGKANTTDLTALNSEVVNARNGSATLSAQLSSMRQTTADGLAGKANASDYTTLNATVTGLGSTVSAQGGRLTTVETSLAGKASSTSVTTLSNEVAARPKVYTGSNAPGQPQPPGPRVVGDQWIVTNLQNRPYVWNGSSWVDNSDGRVSDLIGTTTTLSANYTSQQTAITDLTTGKANASDVSALTTTVNGHTSQIATAASLAATADGRARAIWGVNFDVNGYASGFSSVNDGAKSSFEVLADTFAIRATGTAARTEYIGGIWYAYDATNAVRSSWGRPHGASGQGLTWWTGPNSVAKGSETKANAYVYISMTAPRFGGSDVPTGGPGDVDVNTGGFVFKSGVFGGDWTSTSFVDAATLTLTGIASGASADVTISELAGSASGAGSVQLRVVNGSGAVIAGPVTRLVGGEIEDVRFTGLAVSGSSYTAKLQIARSGAASTVNFGGRFGVTAMAAATTTQAGLMTAQQAADLANLVAGGGGGSGPALATTAPPAVGAAAVGAAATAARGDHTHALPSWLQTNAIVAGSSTGIGSIGLSGGDSGHTGWLGFYDPAGTRRGYIGFATDTGRLLLAADTANGTPGYDFLQRPTVGGVNVALSTEVGGGGVSLTNTAPQSVGSSNAVGNSGEAARANHVHAHGNQAGGSLHANASGSAAGFMSPAHYNLVNGATAGIVNNTLVLRTTYSGNAGSIQCADLLVQRSSGVGAIFFGGPSDYIFLNGSAFVFTKGCQAPSFTPTSDLELKTNLTVDEDDEQALVAICQVARAEWDSTEDGVHRMGVVAQALADLDPRWVLGGEPLDPEGPPADMDGAVVDSDGVTLRRPLRVDPMAMLSSAFAAIRVLTNQNGALESRLSALEAAVPQLTLNPEGA